MNYPEQIAIRRETFQCGFLLNPHNDLMRGLVAIAGPGATMIRGVELEELKAISRYAAAEKN